MDIFYPNESKAYRKARNALIKDELALRAKVEAVAAKRRNLPQGGEIREDYAFTDLSGQKSPLSSHFKIGDTLAVYSLMYAPDAKAACPMCCSLLDGLNTQAPHITQNSNLIVVASAGPEMLRALAETRNWNNLTILSAKGTSYQADYHAEKPEMGQLPMMNIFRKDGDEIRHFWGSEGFYADVEGHPRHLDQLWPLWNVLDLTPDGRGDFMPSLSYS